MHNERIQPTAKSAARASLCFSRRLILALALSYQQTASSSRILVPNMTTYSYSLVLDDSECIALEAALKLLVERCDKELENGPCAPYWAWRESAKRIRVQLYENVQQMSGQGTDPKTGKTTIWIGPRSKLDPDRET